MSVNHVLVTQDKIKTAKVVMGRAVQLQEHEMMQAREREYNQAIDQSMDNQRLQVHRLSLLPASQLQCSCVSVSATTVVSAV